MNDELSKILRKMLIKGDDESFYANFYTQIRREYTTKVNKLQFILDGINLKLLINPTWIINSDRETIINEMITEVKHITQGHFTSEAKRNLECGNKDIFNLCLDLATYDDNNLGLQNKQIPRYYYLHLMDPDYKESISDKSLREVNPELASKIDDLIDEEADIEEWEDLLGVDLQYHLIWDQIQELCNWDTTEISIISLIDDQIDHIILNSYKSCGQYPSNLKERIEGLLQPKKAAYNWKLAFRRCLGNSFSEEVKNSRMRESRRFEEAIGHRHKTNSNILVAIDTSGSISIKELQEFFNELYHIHKTGTKVHILECDAKIQKEYDYKGGLQIPEVTGRGGTDVKPAVNYWNEHNREYDAFVYFTDGYASFVDVRPIKKMIWVISSNGYQENVYPNGNCIFIPKEESR